MDERGRALWLYFLMKLSRSSVRTSISMLCDPSISAQRLRHLNQDAGCAQPFMPSQEALGHKASSPLKHHQRLAPWEVSAREAAPSSSRFLNQSMYFLLGSKRQGLLLCTMKILFHFSQSIID